MVLKVSNRRCQNCGKENPPDSRFCNSCGSTFDSAVPTGGVLLPGTVLRGTYVVESVLGQGGMATVYACHHKSLGTKYALKVLEACHARIEILRERFLSEAKIQATVDHPNIVHVADVIDSDGILAMVMEYVEGQSLDKLIDAKKQFTIKESVEIVLVILDAVGFAHKSNIVHRDLKPSNVMLRADASSDKIWEGIKVMDFGIAKILASDDQRTATGTSMGTPRYMAPEQIEDSRQVDARTDIYSIGIILYELLCGRTPFHELREYELMKAQITKTPPSLRNFRNDIPEKLETIVMKALEKDPNNRYRDAKAFQRALLSLGGFDPVKLLLNPSLSNMACVTSGDALQQKIQAINKSRTESGNDSSNEKSAKKETKKTRKTFSTEENTPKKRSKKIETDKAEKEDLKIEKNSTETESARMDHVEPDESAKKTRTTRTTSKKSPSTGKAPMTKSIEGKSVQKPQSVPQNEPVEPKTQDPGDPSNAPMEPKDKNTVIKIILCVFIAFVLIFGIYYRLSHNIQNNTSSPADNSTADETSAPENSADENHPGIHAALPYESVKTPTGIMTIVPKAKHWISVRDKDGLKLKPVELEAFQIDQTEVPFFQYQKCVAAQACPPIAAPEDPLIPVTNIGYSSAEAFCKWAGKRLPTETEWEAAARFGGDVDGITSVIVDCRNIHFDATGECKQKQAKPETISTRQSSANPGHLSHILGNVREWTSTPVPQNLQKRYVKGGSYLSKKNDIRISAHQEQLANQGAPDIGFRCVK